MNVYQAIREMEDITRQGGTFTFSFMTYSIDKNISHGPRTIQHAILLEGHDSKTTQYSDYLLRFRDMDTYEEKHFWLPLLLNFNGNDIELN